MSMKKRFQVPISEHDEGLIKTAARQAGVSAAEWARQMLRKAASRSLHTEEMTAEEALVKLFALDAPVSGVETMIEESLKGRYR